MSDNLEHNLAQFSGSEHWYRHWTRQLIYTDGIDYLQRNATCFWLVDAIASWQPEVKKISARQKRTDIRDFQIWVLKREPQPGQPNAATLKMYADLPGEPVIVQAIEFTDFPLPEIKLYLERGQEMTLMLPGER